MIGHRQIIEARSKGQRPALIQVEYGKEPPKPKFDWQHPEKQLQYGLYPVVYIKEGDIPDIRFLSGCNVIFNCDGITREARETVKKIISRNPKNLLFRDFKTNALGQWAEGKWQT